MIRIIVEMSEEVYAIRIFEIKNPQVTQIKRTVLRFNLNILPLYFESKVLVHQEIGSSSFLF